MNLRTWLRRKFTCETCGSWNVNHWGLCFEPSCPSNSVTRLENAVETIAADDVRKKLRDRRPAVRQRMAWEDGQGNKHIAEVSFGFDQAGAIREVFCLAKKENTDMQGLVHDACIATSIALQRGARVAELAKSFSELRSEGEQVGRPASVMGYLVRLAASVEAEMWRGAT